MIWSTKEFVCFKKLVYSHLTTSAILAHFRSFMRLFYFQTLQNYNHYEIKLVQLNYCFIGHIRWMIGHLMVDHCKKWLPSHLSLRSKPHSFSIIFYPALMIRSLRNVDQYSQWCFQSESFWLCVFVLSAINCLAY